MISYRFFGRKQKHKLRENLPEDIHFLMKRFWAKNNLAPCDGVTVAYHKGQIIGFFRFDNDRNPRILYAAGTYVLPEYRSDGVAKKLWKLAFKHLKPTQVEVYVASKGGMKLINSLKKKYKSEWIITKYNK